VQGLDLPVLHKLVTHMVFSGLLVNSRHENDPALNGFKGEKGKGVSIPTHPLVLIHSPQNETMAGRKS